MPSECRITPVRHGVNCKKAIHYGEGYLHGEGDDSPYLVDGIRHCGRCHAYLEVREMMPLPEPPEESHDQHKIAVLERALTQSRIDAHAMRDQKDRDMDLVTSRLEAKLHEAQERELALREALEKAQWCIARAMLKGLDMKEESDALEQVLSNTSATAQQTVEKIEREAVEKEWARLRKDAEEHDPYKRWLDASILRGEHRD